MSHSRPHFLWISFLLVVFTETFHAQPAQLVRDIGAGRAFYIYLPAGYDSTDERYPVMYFFRGMEDEWVDRSEDASRQGDIRTVIDLLVRDRTIGKAIYVFPFTPLPMDFPEDGFVPGTLIPYVDNVYRTLPSRYSRAIDGFSWGGLFTMSFIIRYPQLITSAGAYDPSVFALPHTDLSSRIGDQEHMRWMRSLHLHVSTAILGGNNNASTRDWLDTLSHYGVTNSLSELVLDPEAQHNWYFADLHASRNIPRHWAIIGEPASNAAVTLSGIQSGSTVGGSVPLSWSVASADTTLHVFLQVSRDAGARWREVASGTGADSTVQWNTAMDSDGSFYAIRVVAAGDTTFGTAEVHQVRVNNPGNAPPEAFFVGLYEHAEQAGSTTIRWVGGDAEEDSSTSSLAVSTDDGYTWTGLGSSFALTDSVVWETDLFPNGTTYRLRLYLTDGTDTSLVHSPILSVRNVRPSLSAAVTERSQMRGDAEVSIHVVDPTSLAGQHYRVTFGREPVDPYHRASGRLSYDVENGTTGFSVLSDVPVVSGVEEGPVFDGLRLSITDVEAIDFDEAGTRWVSGSSNLSGRLIIPFVVLPPDTFSGRPFPSDYTLHVASVIADTTFSRFGTTPTPVRWVIVNQLTGMKVLQEYLDADLSGSLTHGDEIYFWEVLERVGAGPTDGPDTVLTWQLVLSSPPTLFPPQSGDSLLLAVHSPIHAGDIFEFDAIVTGVSDVARVPDSPELYPAYPNPFNPSTTIRFSLPSVASVTIEICNMLGQRVDGMAAREYRDGVHQIRWDASRLPTGIYVVRAIVRDGHGRAPTKLMHRKVVLLK